ncbi:MAG: hypothetical protein WD876_00875, partial [Candidatus Pacearchaeota archaeon]
MAKINVLREAQDFIVIPRNIVAPTNRDNYVYAAKPSLALMKQFYEQSVSDTNDSKVPVFSDRYWKFDEEKG